MDSNILFLSRLLEQVMAGQLQGFLNKAGCLASCGINSGLLWDNQVAPVVRISFHQLQPFLDRKDVATVVAALLIARLLQCTVYGAALEGSLEAIHDVVWPECCLEWVVGAISV